MEDSQVVITHSRESTRTIQGLGTMRPHLRAQGPARLQEGLDEENLKPWTMSKRNRLSLRPRIHAADPQRRTILPLPSLVFLYRLERLTSLSVRQVPRRKKWKTHPSKIKHLTENCTATAVKMMAFPSL